MVVVPEVLVCTVLNDDSSVIDTVMVGVPDGIWVGSELDGDGLVGDGVDTTIGLKVSPSRVG